MRLVIAGLCLVAIIGAAAAQEPAPTPAALDQVYACVAIASESERLSCYDAAVGRLREAQSSGELLAVDRGQAATIEREAFGLSMPSLPRLFGRREGDEPAVAAVSLEIARSYIGEQSRPVFVMTDGQAWQQIDSASARAVRPGVAVTIRRAAVGSFLMSVSTGGPALRVRRVQ